MNFFLNFTSFFLLYSLTKYNHCLQIKLKWRGFFLRQRKSTLCVTKYFWKRVKQHLKNSGKGLNAFRMEGIKSNFSPRVSLARCNVLDHVPLHICALHIASGAGSWHACACVRLTHQSSTYIIAKIYVIIKNGSKKREKREILSSDNHEYLKLFCKLLDIVIYG